VGVGVELGEGIREGEVGGLTLLEKTWEERRMPGGRIRGKRPIG